FHNRPSGSLPRSFALMFPPGPASSIQNERQGLPHRTRTSNKNFNRCQLLLVDYQYFVHNILLSLRKWSSDSMSHVRCTYQQLNSLITHLTAGPYSFAWRNRRALLMTENELKVMAALAIMGHRNAPALSTEFLHGLALLVRQDIGANVVELELARDRCRRGLAVAREQDDANAVFVERGDRLARGLFDGIGDRDESGNFPIHSDKH